MKLIRILPLAVPFLTAVLAKGSDNPLVNWSHAACDNQPGGKTAETCCTKPPFKNYSVKILQPLNGSCIEVTDGVPFGYQAVSNEEGQYGTPTGPAAQLFLAPNLDRDLNQGESVLFRAPVCSGTGESHDGVFPVESEIDALFEKFKYFTWGFFLGNVATPTTTTQNTFDQAGVTPETGVWLSKDCKKLADDICDGKVTYVPKGNAFYDEAMEGCKSGGPSTGGGQGGSGGGGAGGTGSGSGGQGGSGSGGQGGSGSGGQGGSGQGGAGGNGSGGACSNSKNFHPHSRGRKHKPPCNGSSQ